MIFLEYEALFYKLARYVITILSIKYEQIQYFIQGLRLPLCMATQTLVAAGRSFIEVSNYAYTMEKMHQDAQRGSYKRPHHYGHFSRI